MAHIVDNIDLSPRERRFLDYMEKGDGFMKIEIYRSAKEWYSRALELKPNEGLAKGKLDNCNSLIQSEKKKIIIVVSVIAIAALILVFF